jgi:hypothetical protein
LNKKNKPRDETPRKIFKTGEKKIKKKRTKHYILAARSLTAIDGAGDVKNWLILLWRSKEFSLGWGSFNSKMYRNLLAKFDTISNRFLQSLQKPMKKLNSV